MSCSNKDWHSFFFFFLDESLEEGVLLNNLQESATWASNALDYNCPLSLLTNPWRHLPISSFNVGDNNSPFFINML